VAHAFVEPVTSVSDEQAEHRTKHETARRTRIGAHMSDASIEGRTQS
jgi:hypothetical protein